MVVFLDLDKDVSDDQNPPADLGFALRCHPLNSVASNIERVNSDSSTSVTRPNLNLNVISQALGCYPIISLITSSIDLNTLHSLSLTCHQIRANLLQYRTRLLQQTLHCSNESQHASLAALKPGDQQWHILDESGHLISSKVGACARDLVEECKRCGRVVCRNCTLKPLSQNHLPARHRRLCSSCLSAPLSTLTRHNSPAYSPCTCTSFFHLCGSCGASLTTADIIYHRIWTWRTRYSTYHGTGVGEGNEGVKCARGKDCFNAEDVEVEFECSSSPSGSENGDGDEAGTPLGEKEEAGYWRQEIEGLGGIVKKKYRKRQRVGAPVRAWDDERDDQGNILGREKNGLERSWCAWCARVILGGEDLKDEAVRL